MEEGTGCILTSYKAVSSAVAGMMKAGYMRFWKENCEQEIIRLPWRGQCDRAAAGCARAALLVLC
jgi:hypothetical protein